ncbi:MAG: endonuclease/exonuclease/phosphatase family protein [Elusimicrobiota bacterium]
MKIYKKFKESRNYNLPDSPRYYKNEFTNGSDGTAGLKLVTYNTNFSKKIDKTIGFLQNEQCLKDTDIVCLQEADHAGVERLSSLLEYNYVYYPAVLHPSHNRDFGNAVLTKYNITGDIKVILNPEKTHHFNRIAVGARIEAGGINIVVVSVHMKVFMNAHDAGIQIAKLLDSSMLPGEAFIVAGDFNCYRKPKKDIIFNLFKDKEYIHATDSLNWTFRKWYLFNKKFAVDHIFTKGLKVISSGSIEYPFANDHLSVWAELRIIDETRKKIS